MKTPFVTILLLLLMLKLHASDVQFYSINDIHGISMREINSMCKDDNGFLWASSKTGVLRITDGNYRIYSLPYKTANIISTKLVYANGQLIVSTNNGQLFRYDEMLDRFDFYLDLRDLLDNEFIFVTGLLIDKEDAMWISTSIGLCRYKNEQLEKVEGIQEHIHAIEHYNDNHLFATTDGGIDVVDIHSLEVDRIYRMSDELLQIQALAYDKEEERLWTGTLSDGMFYYDLRKHRLEKINIENLPSQPVIVIEINTDATILIGFDGQGVWKIDKKTNRVLDVYKEDVDNPLSLRGDGVYDIFCDEGNRLWVATYSGGVSYFDQETPLVNQIRHQINNANSLTNNDVNKILEDSRGNIWFATNNGISRWNRTSNRWDTYYKSTHEQAQVFLTLCEDNDGNIWAGSYSSGFYVLDGRTGKELEHYSRKQGEIFNNFIYDIYKDSEGDIWVGGVKSVICYLAKEKRFRAYGGQPVRTFMELAPGKILLACTYTVLLLNKETEEIEYLCPYLSQDIQITGNLLWVGTGGDGLICYNHEDRTTQQFTTEVGLPSNIVNSIVYADGYLWLGTENGLCRFDPVAKTAHVYSTTFALSGISFNVNADLRLKNGDLMFGTNNGAVMFNSGALYHVQFDGRIFFQDIYVAGRSIRENPELLQGIPVNQQTEISLPHHQNNLQLELLPVGVSKNETKFSWKMEGLDNEWGHPSNQQIVNYTNLPAGNLQLKVRMYNSSLSRIIDERVIDIHITPPFWKAWWFLLLAILIFIGILYFSMRIYINRLQQRHAEDKIRFFANTAHDLRTSLTLITAPIEQLNKEKGLTEKGRYYLELARQQMGRLSFVATQLLDFQKVDVGKGQLFPVMVDIVNLVYRRIAMFETAAERDRIRIERSSNCDSFLTAVDELKMEKVVDNLISNAIKYSHPDSKVEVSLTCKTDSWILTVKDYGLGISEKAKKKLFREFYRGDNVVNSGMVGSGIGLLLVKNYVTLHQGTVSLDSKEQEGSTFSIAIPYMEVAETSPVGTKVNAASNLLKDYRPAESIEIIEESGEKQGRLLVVEDNVELHNFLKCSLQDQYNVSIAGDGVEAWDMIQADAPDLIISDIMMPNRDGFELCKLIKSTFETSHIPVILLTALSETTHQLEGLGLGADDYITKPFDMTILSQRIASIIRNRSVVREKAMQMNNQHSSAEELTIVTNELNDQFVKRALEVIGENMDNAAFGRDEFAAAMNVSSSLLYKKMKALVGQSPTDFVKTIRLNHAFELLKSHRYTITELSELCGFASVSYFSTAFKKRFGKAPTEFL
ncbi:response regulator [Bacteroides sp. OttesenSCG-928-D19]|nr:response regulator [Bacteroides sp. OttesenSCG-928-D19]